MYLNEMLQFRRLPAAGLFMAVTRRCPLSCAHCSTNSSLQSEEADERIFSDFAATFTPERRPSVLSLTGGEPLLRPRLVIDLARRAHAVGSKVTMITGMFFARKSSHVRLLDEALDAVDHITASLDFYHEREVDRQLVFPQIERLLARGKAVSFQLTGNGPADSYLTGLIAAIRERFDDRVPMFVSRLGAAGRARELLQLRRRERQPLESSASPCSVATWPVIAFDGSVVACCNQDVVDGAVPAPHLRLGHAATHTWDAVATEVETRLLLRGLRTLGPDFLSELGGVRPGKSYCETCQTLSADPNALARMEAVLRERLSERLELAVRQLMEQNASYGDPAFRELNALGERHEATAHAS